MCQNSSKPFILYGSKVMITKKFFDYKQLHTKRVEEVEAKNRDLLGKMEMVKKELLEVGELKKKVGED
ncbi:hypothetical protein VNO80_19894 [Phaseolus coccineus]|uniref:Uncharacterized protein n=1 Tax=Phaseolus coccineus TaxID=3886 RepID=A0AAN9MID0_PHACN